LANDGALYTRLGAQVSAVRADQLPHARDVARLATQLVAAKQIVSPEEAVPVYLRDQVVQSGSRKS
jgi:tRNA A37 threonylcarbamoyladenosine modification protein TsaB